MCSINSISRNKFQFNIKVYNIILVKKLLKGLYIKFSTATFIVLSILKN